METQMLPSEIRQSLPHYIVGAWDFIKERCRHYATIGRDTQTREALTPKEQIYADVYLHILDDAGLLVITQPNGKWFYKGNFIVLDLDRVRTL